MKPFSVALALILAGSLFGASAAQAATPKEGRWTVKIEGPSGPAGAFGVAKKGKFSYSRSVKSGSTTSRYSLSGRFTSSGKASGVLRTRFTGDPKRTCDSGELKWKASRK